MKQQITKEQVYELNKKQYYRYLDYFKEMESMVGSLVFFEPVEDDKLLPCMSIGQMIEFLYEHQRPALIIAIPDKPNNNWCLSLPDSLPIKDHEPIYADQLCDALWGAVKEVLNME